MKMAMTPQMQRKPNTTSTRINSFLLDFLGTFGWLGDGVIGGTCPEETGFIGSGVCPAKGAVTRGSSGFDISVVGLAPAMAVFNALAEADNMVALGSAVDS
jgi:hypothetical protein